MENNRDFDLIIWGATGFTGDLVCEYINNNYEYNELKWAIGGRNQNKLLKLQKNFYRGSDLNWSSFLYGNIFEIAYCIS